MHGYKALTFIKCTTIMISELTVMSGLGSSRDYMIWVWYGLGWFLVRVYVELCDP
jgi:hypothetical protein